MAGLVEKIVDQLADAAFRQAEYELPLANPAAAYDEAAALLRDLDGRITAGLQAGTIQARPQRIGVSFGACDGLFRLTVKASDAKPLDDMLQQWSDSRR